MGASDEHLTKNADRHYTPLGNLMDPSYHIKDSDGKDEAASLVANAPKAAPTLKPTLKKGWGKAAELMTPKSSVIRNTPSDTPQLSSAPIAEAPPPSLGNANLILIGWVPSASSISLARIR